MEMKQIVELIQTVSKSSLSTFRYEEGDTCLTLEVKQGPDVYTKETANVNVVYGESKEEKSSIQDKAVNEEQEVGKIITSPIVGTFYCAKEEGATPYVSVGDVIKKGQTIGIVEAMKLMNEVESQYEGTVAEVFVEDGMLVEFGQPLVRIVL